MSMLAASHMNTRPHLGKPCTSRVDAVVIGDDLPELDGGERGAGGGTRMRRVGGGGSGLGSMGDDNALPWYGETPTDRAARARERGGGGGVERGDRPWSRSGSALPLDVNRSRVVRGRRRRGRRRAIDARRGESNPLRAVRARRWATSRLCTWPARQSVRPSARSTSTCGTRTPPGAQ